MKSIIILALCLLAGCTVGPTLEQLEAEALISGDWSAVERREAAIAKRRARNGPVCQAGLVAVCERYSSYERCSCVAGGDVYTLVERLQW